MLASAATISVEPAAGGDVIVRPAPSEIVVQPGELFEISLLADLPDPVLGWGLDLGMDPGILSVAETPATGPLWQPVPASDGDGLAAYAFPGSVSGSDILLATVTLSADAVGETDLILSTTPGDLTEGFPLDPDGFATAVFAPGHVTVVPEPVSVFLAAAGWFALRAPGGRRWFRKTCQQ
jgi:hypothetical protein